MNGLLVVPPICGNKKNIGDYIQSVAQEQFGNYIDCYVEREKIASFHSEEKTNLIMNGWFMWNAEQFPPSDCINPFLSHFIFLHQFLQDYSHLYTNVKWGGKTEKFVYSLSHGCLKRKE